MFSRETIIVAGIASLTVFVIEEVRAFTFLKEADRRFNEQSVRLANLTERLEMLEP